MIRSLALVAVCVLSSNCFRQSDGWQEFVYDDAGFSVSLPCKPVKEVQEYQYSVGKRYGYTFICDKNGKRIKLNFGDHNPQSGESVQKFLEYSEGDIEFAGRDSIKSKQDISIDGYAGRRYDVSPGSDRNLMIAVTSNKKGIFHLTVGPIMAPMSIEDEKLFKRIVDSTHFLPK